MVLSDTAEFCYKCDDFYHANDEGGLAWNDPEIGIEWPQVVGKYIKNIDAAVEEKQREMHLLKAIFCKTVLL